jgi:hypothetical protein
MTFQAYFTEVQTLITTEINLPFDCLFSKEWQEKYSPEFQMLHKDSITPAEAVKIHFADIESQSLKNKRNKTLMY